MFKNCPKPTGGARPNSGPKPYWVRAQCLKAIRGVKKNPSAIKFLEQVWRGEINDHKVTKDGDVIEVPASIHDRTFAATYLIDQGGGKAAQSMAVSGTDGSPLTVKIVNFADTQKAI